MAKKLSDKATTRRSGYTKLVYDKAKRAIASVKMTTSDRKALNKEMVDALEFYRDNWIKDWAGVELQPNHLLEMDTGKKARAALNKVPARCLKN